MRTLSHMLSLTSLLGTPSPGAAAPPATVCVAPKPKVEQVESADRSVLVYVQQDPTRMDETSTSAVPHEALCLIRNGGAPALLLEGRPMPAKGEVSQTLATFGQLLLSKDSNTLYFTSAAWVTSGAAHMLDLRTGKERFLIDGAVIEAPEVGPFRGRLVVSSFRIDDKHSVESPQYRGRMEVWTVIDKYGHLVKRLPEDEKERERMLSH